MAFSTTVAWTASGERSRSVLMTNAHVAEQGEFCLALNQLIRSWCSVKYSQTPPRQTMYPRNGFGTFSWDDGANGTRQQAVQFSFDASDWVAGVGVRVSMQSVS